LAVRTALPDEHRLTTRGRPLRAPDQWFDLIGDEPDVAVRVCNMDAAGMMTAGDSVGVGPSGTAVYGDMAP